MDDRYRRLLAGVAMMAMLACARAQQPDAAPAAALGGPAYSNWSGLSLRPDGSAVLRGHAEFRYPDGKRGFYNQGFRRQHDGARDWHNTYGVQFEVQGSPAARGITVAILPPDGGKPAVSASVTVQGGGWHTVTLPWSAFNIETARSAYLLHVKGLRISADGKLALAIRDPRVTMGAAVSLAAPVRGKAVPAGATASYELTLGNPTRAPLSVSLAMVRYGWEKMRSQVSPAAVSLQPGQTAKVTVQVEVAANIPQGGHERQIVQAVPNGNAGAAAQIELITSSEIAGPHVLFNPARWDEVRAKVAHHAWARQEQAAVLKTAEAWQVPDMREGRRRQADDTQGAYLIQTAEAQGLLANGKAWQLTRERKYADKVALFMRRLSDPRTGYPSTFRATNQSLVQEGHLFQHIAMAYDMVRDAGVITADDRAQVEHTFRLLMDTMDRARLNGSINNWAVSELTGALYCALAIGDFAQADSFFSGPSGIIDQLAKGTMDDGWWNEASISYNTWVAGEFTQIALALENWGINFKDMWVPASYSEHVLLDSEMPGGAPPGAGADYRPFGMSNEVWGPNRQSYRTIADLWNSLLPFLDYRGVMFGVNDSTENKVGGYRHEIGAAPFELAYYAFRNPRYAAIVKLDGGKRDLLYGVPDLPQNTPADYRGNAVADNVGLVMQRSQTPGREQREQIQAALHYGSHGWAHGHFDRTNLLSLMRYGRSFYNPEAAWWGYAPFMYKFYVQTSLSHNMVVVDRKMQEAAPGRRTLFYSGKMMQASAVETTARWSYPPYGGMVYGDIPEKTFKDKAWSEGKYVPVPDDAPVYGSLTGYTEPILQRRLMVVTDDYVLLADYVKGEQPHVYDSLFQMKGFQGLDAAGLQLARHDKQWDADPLGSAQFVTDVDNYTATAPVRAGFEMRFGPGADNAGTRALFSEDGALKLDVHTLYPQRQQLMVGTVPEDHRTDKRLFYTVRGDGKPLAEGKFGAWILGDAALDVALEGVRQLELETRTEQSKTNSVFWANARVVTRSGEEIPLARLPVTAHNIVAQPAAGLDYDGGPVKIAGALYAAATAGEPLDARLPGTLRIDLSGIDAVRFKTVLGGDYPLGDEAQRRKTYGQRQEGREARFLTLIEPYEGKRMVLSAAALDAHRLEIRLADGRIQEIDISNLDGDTGRPGVKLVERRGGRVLREESSGAAGDGPASPAAAARHGAATGL